MRPGPRLQWTFVLVSVVLVAAAVPAGAADPYDPWAPGTSIEPWPLIAQLQSPAALGDDAAAWESALRHADPMARAAAAFAAGRVKPPGATALLAGLVHDRDLLVRDAALWALLRLDGTEALSAAAQAMADRREVTRSFGSPDTKRPGEPPATFGWMFMRRGIPVAASPVAERRAWLARVDLAVLQPRKPSTAVVDSVTWSMDRSEWDAGERILIRMVVDSEGGKTWLRSLGTTLVVLDEPDAGPGTFEKRTRIPATPRRTDGEPGIEVSPDATGRRTMDLSLSLHDLPPGPYLLEGISAGNPLLLRIRRSPAREAAVQEAARAAETAAEIEAIGRYRVASAAERLRDRLRAALIPPSLNPGLWEPDAVTWTLAAALGRLEDAESAKRLVAALAGPFVAAPRGTGQILAHNPLVTRFGEAALPSLAAAASRWRAATTGQWSEVQFAASVLASPAADSAALDETRAEVLEAMGPLLVPTDPSKHPPPSKERDLFYAALAGLAPRRPDVVGRALAGLADRPALLSQALQAFQPPAYSGYPYALDIDVIERVFAAARMAMGTQAPPDALAALAGEAVRLHVPLPEATLPQALVPQSAAEAKREVMRVWPRHLPSETAVAALRRVIASGFAEKDPEVALHAAGLALDIGLYAEAERLAEVAVALAPSGDNRDALLMKNRARGAQGDRQAEMAAMQALSGAQSTETVARRRLAELQQEKPSRLRVRRREDRYADPGVPLGDGSVLLVGRDQTVQIRDLARGGLTPVAVAPWPARAVARVDSRRVVAVSTEGNVALLQQGSPRPLWQAKVGLWCQPNSSQCGAIASTSRVIVLRDATHVAYALDAATGRVLWTRPAGQGPPLILDGADPVVLAVPASDPHIITGISGVDPRIGTVRWTRAVPRMSGTWRLAGHRLSWIERGSVLHVVDVRDGSETLVELAAATNWPPSAIAIAPSGTVVYAVVADTLFAVTGGAISWRREVRPSTGGSYKSFHLEAGAETIWLVAQGKEGRSLTVLAPDGEPVATRSWGATANSSAVPMLVDSRTLEVPVGDNSELLDLLPEAR